jgi:tRNA(adenine34) deaminase
MTKSKMSSQQDQYWMHYAQGLAAKASAQDEIPVGAVLVKDNTAIGEGWNQSIMLNDPSAHAEMQAIRQAGRMLGNYRLIDTTLYVTLEPCTMCAGLLVHSRIQRLVFGAYDAKTGSAGSIMNVLGDGRLNHQVSVQGGVLGQECGDLISAFFRRRRAAKKALKPQAD